MGGAPSRSRPAEVVEPPKTDTGASNNIDLQLMEQQLDELYKFKILLLGAGECGKSTVVKQLKLIHKKKVSDHELRFTAQSLHQNIVDCMQSLLRACHTFGYNEEMTDEDRSTEHALAMHDESQRLSPPFATRIIKLFHSDAIQKTFARRSEYWLLDSFPYYMKNIERFCEDDFLPTEEDSLMARIRTTGIVNSELEQRLADKKDPHEPDLIKFDVVDVGGQRNERKKWIHCFDDVRAILFVVNLAGYNQVLFEDASKNRMQEELELLEQISSMDIFRDTPIFLFFNKKDLFEQMILDVDLCNTFPDYTGGKNLQPALDYIVNAFRAKLPPHKQSTTSIHLVTARWKGDIKAAFDAVKKTLYDANRDELLKQANAIRAARKSLVKEVAKEAAKVEKEKAKEEKEKEKQERKQKGGKKDKEEKKQEEETKQEEKQEEKSADAQPNRTDDTTAASSRSSKDTTAPRAKETEAVTCGCAY